MNETYEKNGIVYPEGCIEVLDKGFVNLVDFMGSDESIVQAARVSYGKGTKKVNEDRGLIRYLLRHQHMTPFEMCELKFHCKMPIFIARQWVRHRTASINEYSARYSEVKDEFYLPEIGRVAFQSNSNKQGSGGEVPETLAKDFIFAADQIAMRAMDEYNIYNEAGIAKELNRISMPVSNYTEWYWKLNLRNFFGFCKLRLDPHAQYEIRVFAEAMYKIVKEKFPLACEAFEDYELKGAHLSRMELNTVRDFLMQHGDYNISKRLTENGASEREVNEFIKKIRSL